MKLMKGYIQVYTGDGKGKTTAALGLALRAAGAGLRVYMAQFLKKGDYSEIRALARFSDLITVEQFGLGHFVKGKPAVEDIDAGRRGLQRVKKILASGQHQVVILDDDGKISKVIAAHDGGKVMNEMLFEGQIEGAVHMGLGYALTEDLPMKNGRLLSAKFRNIGILRAKEMPEVEVIPIEEKDPVGPYGAKGIGEIGLVPTAAAVAGAYYSYDGKVRYKLPMNRTKQTDNK